MHMALLMVGAHNGEKQRDMIAGAAERGMVILIEPVPYLFAILQRSYAGNPNVICLNVCVAPQAGKVRFFAPTQDAIKAFPWGDQLGSLRFDHAVRHETALAPHIVEMQADGVTFSELVVRYDISTLDMLFTDTEGYDAILLPLFPFDRVRPEKIMFEYKHTDGTNNIGRTLGHLLILLDVLGYDMAIVDAENCLATRRTGTGA